MSVQSIQLNTLNTDSNKNTVKKPYLEAKGAVRTGKRVKPLPPKGHLVDDTPISGIKYFFKDIGYDIKSVKDGIVGNANDHQLGRLNDVGLRLGGIGIATYLASQTTNPKVRLMEYIGLATFLTSMSIYPKIAITAPARILHGYDTNKEYIDDQGRKKSVHQDSNYIPYDMYRGKNKGEDIDAIGDKMGIPRDIKNRHDVIKEQMRKIATQNNTLWMLTAGFATPLITALLCSGIEKYIVSLGLEKTRNARFDTLLKSALSDINETSISSGTADTSLGISIKNIVSKAEGKPISKEDYKKILELFTEEIDSTLSEGIKSDLERLLFANKTIKIDNGSLTAMFDKAGKSMLGGQTEYIIKNILPSENEIIGMIREIKPNSNITNGIEFTEAEFNMLQNKIADFANSKILTAGENARKHENYIRTNVQRFANSFKLEPSPVITKESAEKIIKFANIMGEFKKRAAILDKCASFKFEHTPESILANYYGKFQKELIKQLEISPKDLKRISNDKAFAATLLDNKINELCKNETKYKQAFEKLGEILTKMETSLHGKAEDASQILNLLNGIDTVYNNAAKTLLESGFGESTANMIVKGDFSAPIKTKEELLKFMDGLKENEFVNKSPYEQSSIEYFAKGKGSSKNLKKARIINRYQGEVNSFFRIFHTLDFYKRSLNAEELLKLSSIQDKNYLAKLEKNIKEALVKGNISDFILKLGIESPSEYRDFYNIGWATEAGKYGQITQKGILTDSAKEALNKNKEFNLAERLQFYITKFKNIISNDTTDFTKPEHILDTNLTRNYSDYAKTNEAKFNIVSQSPADMLQNASGKMHADRMWLKSVGKLAGIVFGITLLAQFSFGKLNNKHNLQKIQIKQRQVANESNQ